MNISRRDFLKISASTGTAYLFAGRMGGGMAQAAYMPTLDPLGIAKYVSPLVIPPAMPRTTQSQKRMGRNIDYYEIAVRQFSQQILPNDLPATTVWSYGSANHPETFNYPAFTIEARFKKPVRVKWINGLVDAEGHCLPHLLPVDQTLHWANPPGGVEMRDMHGLDPTPYTGPVPIVTHVHGAHTREESDGYPEAWYLPAEAATDPAYAAFAQTGTWYDHFKAKAEARHRQTWEPGSAVFQYPNDQRAATLWYHDHTLGMTRLNVYAGPAGFYLLRDGPGEVQKGLPGPAPALGDPPGTRYYEIPLAIQDRSFNSDGSLFFPDARAFFEGLTDPADLAIPFIPDEACDGNMSDVSPIWNPEFFGNTMVVNGKTWPVLTVEPRRYRFRLLNGCNGRFIILKLATDAAARRGVPALPFWQVGAEGGFLPAPVQLQELLIAPAERADVIVDFTGLPEGAEIFLINEGPYEPFGGGVPGTDFPFADPETTGQVMKFVVGPLAGEDVSLPPDELNLPPIVPLHAPATPPRLVSLNEEDSRTVRVIPDEDENGTAVTVSLNCEQGEPFGPVAALCGVIRLDENGAMEGDPRKWMDPITENPGLRETEDWEIHNFTMDAHPIHIHQVMFQVISRTSMMTGVTRPPEASETGWKDTVIAYPDEVTVIRARFDIPGLFVWHCHIVDHEDNEMMRPYHVGPIQPMPPTG